MSTELQGAISSAISQANDKAAQKSEGNFNEQVARDRVSSANSRISVAESKVTRNQGEVAKIDEQLNPPPTKEVEKGGKSGGTKTVVDQDEVRKLNSKKSGVEQSLAQAQQEVKTAQEGAQNASSEAITQAGINSETQTEMDALLAKASNIKETLSQGGKVEDSEIKDLTDRFGKVAGQLTEENNPSGLLSEAFYKPFANTLKEISALLGKEAAPAAGEAAPTASGTTTGETQVAATNLPAANKELFDVGITDLEEQNKFITFNEEVNAFSKGIKDNGGKFNEEFSETKFSEIIAKNNTQTGPLNDAQKNTGVIKQNQDSIQAIKEATGTAA